MRWPRRETRWRWAATSCTAWTCGAHWFGQPNHASLDVLALGRTFLHGLDLRCALSGWPHHASLDVLALGGSFLHGLDLRCAPFGQPHHAPLAPLALGGSILHGLDLRCALFGQLTMCRWVCSLAVAVSARPGTCGLRPCLSWHVWTCMLLLLSRWPHALATPRTSARWAAIVCTALTCGADLRPATSAMFLHYGSLHGPTCSAPPVIASHHEPLDLLVGHGKESSDPQVELKKDRCALCFRRVADAIGMEARLGVSRSARFPLLRPLLWRVAAHYAAALRPSARGSAPSCDDGLLVLADRTRASAQEIGASAEGPMWGTGTPAEGIRTLAGGSGAPAEGSGEGGPWSMVSPCKADGLPALAGLLGRWAAVGGRHAHRGGAPHFVPDPQRALSASVCSCKGTQGSCAHVLALHVSTCPAHAHQPQAPVVPSYVPSHWQAPCAPPIQNEIQGLEGNFLCTSCSFHSFGLQPGIVAFAAAGLLGDLRAALAVLGDGRALDDPAQASLPGAPCTWASSETRASAKESALDGVSGAGGGRGPAELRKGPPCALPLGGGDADHAGGCLSAVDLALAPPPDPDPSPAGCSPGSAAPALRGAPGALLQPPHGSPSAGDDCEEEEEDDSWEAGPDEEYTPCRARRSASSAGRPAKRLRHGAPVRVPKRPRVKTRAGGGSSGGSGGDDAARPGAVALGCRPAHGRHEETAAPGAQQALPEQARRKPVLMWTGRAARCMNLSEPDCFCRGPATPLRVARVECDPYFVTTAPF